MTLRLGTRGSQLALYQATTVASLIRARTGRECELITIKTSGDRLVDVSLSQAGGKGLFVKELEDALLADEIDLAVHSSKDMAAVLPPGLMVAAVLPREDPRDALVLPLNTPAIATLGELASRCDGRPRIGTSSVRRSAQLIRAMPGAVFMPIRGNLDSRLRKLDAGDHDALVLAAAGLIRLGQRDRISAMVPVEVCVPAPGQGIIAIETRTQDHALVSVLAQVNDPVARGAFDAERAVVARLGGGCQMPLGAYASLSSGSLSLLATVLSLDGTQALRTESQGRLDSPLDVGYAAAEALLAQGAERLMSEATGRTGAPIPHQP